MWFSYPMEDSWIPLEIDRVKEIQQQNKDGIFPPDLGESVEIESKPVKVLDYENVVGQDSLTRLDERNRNKKKTKNKNKNKLQDNKPPQGVVVQQQPKEQKPAEANKSNDPNKKNRNNRRFKPNRNNRNDQNKGNESGS